MAIAPAQPYGNTVPSIYKPAISYQKKIDIDYNLNYGLGIDVAVNPEYRYTFPIKPPENVEPDRFLFGNFSTNTKNTSTSRNAFIESSTKTILEKDRINIGQSIQNNSIHTMTGKLKDDAIPVISNKVVGFDSAKSSNISSTTFAKPQKPSVNNIKAQITPDKNINDLEYSWDWFNGEGSGIDYLPLPAPYYDTCQEVTWICIQDL